MTDKQTPLNDNKDAWQPGGMVLYPKPDDAYVKDYLDKMLAHFRECKIDPDIVAPALMNALFRYSPGDPYEKLPDEGAIHQGLSCLSPQAHAIELRVEAYFKALSRLHADRMNRLAQKWGCSVDDAFERWKRERFEDTGPATTATGE